MTKALSLLAALVLLGLTATASAQDTADEQVTRYEFEDDLITGDLVRTDVELLIIQRRGGHESLIRPRYHFVPELMKSVERL